MESGGNKYAQKKPSNVKFCASFDNKRFKASPVNDVLTLKACSCNLSSYLLRSLEGQREFRYLERLRRCFALLLDAVIKELRVHISGVKKCFTKFLTLSQSF